MDHIVVRLAQAGVATRLMREVERWALANGAELVAL
jgi:hypothetical protein